MLIHKSYSFYSDNLNDIKFNLLYLKANDLLLFKNQISNTVFNNPLEFINKSKFDWINHFRCTISSCNNQDISNAIEDVYVAYNNKISNFISNTSVKIQDKLKIVYYKKSGNHYNKGDVKSFNIEFKSTNLSKVVTYLVRYYDENLINYITNNPNEIRESVLFYVNKYGDRLINLIKSIQNKIIKNTFNHKITFTSLSFNSCTEQKQNIINKNPNTHSIYNAYITLSGQKTDNGKLHIPIKYSSKHHGSLKDYYKEPNGKGQRVISYNIVFVDKNKIRITLTKKVEDFIISNKTKYYGNDVNIKHNLFNDKHGNTIDFDRELVNDYVKFIKKLDSKHSGTLNKREEINKRKWQIRIKDMLKRKSNLLVKQCINLGYDHIILEDLKHMGKSYVRMEDIYGFKVSRLLRLLNLSDIKNIVSSIAHKNKIQVTFIQPHYTSKCCDKCGLIDDKNRKIQEIFECVSCGNKSNADTHSAKMIEDRLALDVLRQSLLVNSNGNYKPKILNKTSIKNILADCYDIKQ